MPEDLNPYAWLDPLIEQQAKHYGLTVEQKATLFKSAAEYDEEMLTNGEDQ